MPTGYYKRTKKQIRNMSLAKMGHTVSQETREKIRKANKKMIFTKEHRAKLKERATGLKGEKARNWKGDKVGSIGIHCWLRREYGTPRDCDHCHRTDQKFYDWASVDHKYVRDRKKFLRLCRSCHSKYDCQQKNRKYKKKFYQFN